jgi:hypothetical protein
MVYILDEKTHIIISKATQAIMKKEGLWSKILSIGQRGYVIAGCFVAIHSKIAASRKCSDFQDLLENGWIITMYL